MSQHDFILDNAAGAAFRADANLAIQALASQSSGASAPGTMYAYQRWADTTTGVVKRRNAANSAWVIDGTLIETYGVARSSNTILAAADQGKFFRATASFTQTLTAVATLGDGWWCHYRIDSGASITFDPNSTEQIDGATTKTIVGPAAGTIFCTGAAFFTYGFDGLTSLAMLTKAIHGLTYANNGSDATNDIDIAAGGAMDATGAYWMTLGSALTKQLDAAWAVGTNAGGLDTGSIGNSDYYIWLIARSDTGVVDVLFSLSSTAPTMPASYDYKRLIGWFKRVGGTIVAFTTYETEGGGIELSWNVPTLDINLANTLTTSRRTDAVKVPLNISTIAHLNIFIYDATSSGVAWICCPDEGDAAPSQSAAPLANITWAAGVIAAGVGMKIRTSATGTIAARSNVATTDSYFGVTLGFTWARRN